MYYQPICHKNPGYCNTVHICTEQWQSKLIEAFCIIDTCSPTWILFTLNCLFSHKWQCQHHTVSCTMEYSCNHTYMLQYSYIPWGQMLFCLGKVTRVTHTSRLASFPGPAQLSITFSMVKLGEPGIFSPEYDVHVVRKWWKFAELTGCVLGIFNRLHAQCSVCNTIASH